MLYNPDNMIRKSRFVDFYKNCSIEVVESVKKYMSKFIQENAQYTDRGNYTHLCNLFTSMAFCFTYEDMGKSREQSIEIVANAMYKFIQPQTIKMKKLSKNALFIPFLKLTMPLRFKKTLGYGWKVEFPNKKKNEFTMITHECIYCQLFSKYDIFELTAVFCHVDDLLYGNLPGAEFIYTQQKGCGGKYCDYTYRKR